MWIEKEQETHQGLRDVANRVERMRARIPSGQGRGKLYPKRISAERGAGPDVMDLCVLTACLAWEKLTANGRARMTQRRTNSANSYGRRQAAVRVRAGASLAASLSGALTSRPRENTVSIRRECS